MRWFPWVAFCLLLLCNLAQAEDLAEPVLAIRAKRWLNVVEGKIQENAVVLVQGDTIQAVAPERIPPGAKVLDLGDVTLLPGLFDVHTHLTYDEDDPYLKKWRHGKSLTATAAAYALTGAKNAKKTLLAGFTTVRDLGACCYADVTLGQAIDAGLVDGPSIVASGYIITTTGGGCSQSLAEPQPQFDPQHGIADSPQELVEAVRFQVLNGAKVIKSCVDDQNFTEEELKILVDAAHRRHVKTAAHVWETESVKAAVLAGFDSIEHVTLLDEEVVHAMVERGTVLVPTLYASESLDLTQAPPKLRERLAREMPLYKESLKLALRMGVKIAFGSDSGQIVHGENAKEFGWLVDQGMPPIDAIRAATIQAAQLLEIEDRGRIEAGLRADLIAVPGNPLEDVHVLEKVRFVMKSGKIYKGGPSPEEQRP